MHNTQKRPLYNLQSRSRSACASRQSDLTIPCSSTYTTVSIDSLSRQWRPWLVLLKKLTDLDLHCLSLSIWICMNNLDQVIFFFFFLIWVLWPFQEYFTYIETILHQRWAKTGEPAGKKNNTWLSVSRTWLSHMWPEQGLNHSGEKPNGLRVNSPIH